MRADRDTEPSKSSELISSILPAARSASVTTPAATTEDPPDVISTNSTASPTTTAVPSRAAVSKPTITVAVASLVRSSLFDMPESEESLRSTLSGAAAAVESIAAA